MLATDSPSLTRLCESPGAPAAGRLVVLLPEIGGGRQTDDTLRRLDAAPDATELIISGLDQRSFETVVRGHGARFRGIFFWKCPLVADLSPLEELPGLTHVAIYWNQRATCLWDLRRTPRLQGLQFEDFTRLHDLKVLAAAVALEELVFGDKVWDTSTFSSLDPIGQLRGLRRLRFTAKHIDDRRIQPVRDLQRLTELWFPAKLFSPRQLAWLRARLPESVQCESLAPFRRLPPDPQGWFRGRDVAVNGRDGRLLNSTLQAGRLARHVEAFERCVAHYRRVPEEEPTEAPLA